MTIYCSKICQHLVGSMVLSQIKILKSNSVNAEYAKEKLEAHDNNLPETLQRRTRIEPHMHLYH